MAKKQAKEETPEMTAGQKMAATLRKHRTAYTATKSHSGKPSLDNGDPIAEALRGMTPDQAIAVAERLVEGCGDLKVKYGKLNDGQKRMNSGNLIRNAHKRKEITIKQIKDAVKA